MEKFRLNLKEGIKEHHRLIATDYWKINERRFIFKIEEIAEKYSMTKTALAELIQRTATCSQFVGVCNNCQEEIWYTVHNRTSFHSLKQKKQCEDCREKDRKKWLEEVAARNRKYEQRENTRQISAERAQQPLPSSTLKFSLAQNINKIKPKQPNYSGTFVLQQDVVLRAGVKYLYSGWE